MKTLNKINQFLSIHSVSKAAVLAAGLLVFVSCTQDKSLDQFRQQQANNYAAQYNAVVAKYTGPVISNQGNSKLGSMTLQIESGKQVQSSSDGLGNEAKAVLTGHLIYNGLNQATIAFTQGYYNPADGTFNVTVPVTDEAGNAQSITVDGGIQSGTFVGSVYMTQYRDAGLTVNLSVNNNSTGLDAYDAKSLRAQQLAQDSMSFIGPFSYIDNSGASHASTMKIQVANPAMNPQQQFLRLVNPVRIVSVDVRTLNFRSDGSAIGYEPLFAVSSGTSVGGPITFSLTDAEPAHAAQLGGAGLVTGLPVGMNCIQQQVDSSTKVLGWNCSFRGGDHPPKNVILSPDPNAP